MYSTRYSEEEKTEQTKGAEGRHLMEGFWSGRDCRESKWKCGVNAERRVRVITFCSAARFSFIKLSSSSSSVVDGSLSRESER